MPLKSNGIFYFFVHVAQFFLLLYHQNYTLTAETFIDKLSIEQPIAQM